MLNTELDILNLITAAAFFLLFLSVWVGLVLLWSARQVVKRKKMERRLGLVSGTNGESRVLHLWHEGGEATTVVPGSARRLTLHQRLSRALRDAGFDAPISVTFSVLGLLTIAVGLASFVILGNVLITALCMVAPVVAFKMLVKSRIDRRTAAFERQFVDAMQLASRSLRTGHPLMGAFQLVAEELPPPVSDLFSEICQNHELGADLSDSLAQAAQNTPTSDVRLFTASIAIQVRSGGSLADMMDRLAAVVRDRMRIVRKARVLSAQTQLSKRILIVLPIAMFVFLNFIATDYMEVFYTTFVGNVMLVAAAAGLVLGAWVMSRMAVVKY